MTTKKQIEELLAKHTTVLQKSVQAFTRGDEGMKVYEKEQAELQALIDAAVSDPGPMWVIVTVSPYEQDEIVDVVGPFDSETSAKLAFSALFVSGHPDSLSSGPRQLISLEKAVLNAKADNEPREIDVTDYFYEHEDESVR